MIRLSRAPLFLQMLGLVIATLVAAQVAALVVILSLPPPQPEVYSVRDVLAALHGGGATTSSEGRPLATTLATSPPANETWGSRRLAFRAMLARALGVDPAR